MNALVTVKKQKKETHTTLHHEERVIFEACIANRTNVIVCGGSGVGKTTFVQSVLDDMNSLEVTFETIKKLDLIEGTAIHLFLDDYDGEFKSIVERVSDGKSPTRGSFVLTTKAYTILPHFHTIFLKEPRAEDVSRLLGTSPHPFNGNMHHFKSYASQSDTKDVFKTPKEFVRDIICESGPVHIFDSLSEHGHIWDTIQENYLDSKGIDYVCASDSLSQADIYDTRIYNGEWDLMQYFILHALVIPKSHFGSVIARDKVRPGSAWTKYGNTMMRSHKLRDIERRTNLRHQDLCLIKKYAEKGDVSLFFEYNLSSQDFDVMNHISLQSKLKQKDVSLIKKAINYGPSSSSSRT